MVEVFQVKYSEAKIYTDDARYRKGFLLGVKGTIIYDKEQAILEGRWCDQEEIRWYADHTVGEKDFRHQETDAKRWGNGG